MRSRDCRGRRRRRRGVLLGRRWARRLLPKWWMNRWIDRTKSSESVEVQVEVEVEVQVEVEG